MAIESRGFIFGAPLARSWNVPFVPARKFGKLPGRTVRQEYSLEYGEDTLELHADALRRGSQVVVEDDLLATGGKAAATVGTRCWSSPSTPEPGGARSARGRSPRPGYFFSSGV